MHTIIAKLNRYFCSTLQMAVLDDRRGLWMVDPYRIAYLKAQNTLDRHILIRPAPVQEPYYFLADDLNLSLLDAHHRDSTGNWRPGRMIIETSPRNFQVWIHASRRVSLDEKRYWLRKMESDPGADPNHRWGRSPGFFNRKHKYRSDTGDFPLSKLIWVDWRYTARIPEIFDQNFAGQLRTQQTRRRAWPIRRSDYDRNNESLTDFAYALALARRHYSKQQIIDRLLVERTDWSNHEGDIRKRHYLETTVSKAIAIIQNYYKT